MVEHVGVRNYPRYFGKIRRMLKPGGLVLNHGITHNWLGHDSLGSGIGNFIEEYVFPGGQLAHVSQVIQGLAADGLELIDAEALREHYARTLWHWVDRLESERRRCAAARSGRKNSVSGASILPGRRTPSTAAGCRSFSCSRASRSPMAACRIRRRASTFIGAPAPRLCAPARRPHLGR